MVLWANWHPGELVRANWSGRTGIRANWTALQREQNIVDHTSLKLGTQRLGLHLKHPIPLAGAKPVCSRLLEGRVTGGWLLNGLVALVSGTGRWPFQSNWLLGAHLTLPLGTCWLPQYTFCGEEGSIGRLRRLLTDQ